MTVRRPLVLDNGEARELPIGDALPKTPGSIVDLEHVDGLISLNVQLADLFRFKADQYTPSANVSVIDIVKVVGSADVDLTSMPLIEGDAIVLIEQQRSPLHDDPSGFSEISEDTAGDPPICFAR